MRSLAAVAALFLAGCGTTEPAPVPTGPPAGELRIGMQEYAFGLSAGALEAGPVTVVVTNAGGAAHDVVLRQGDQEIGRSDVLSPGDSQTLEVQVERGSPVHLECTLTGHSTAGMHTSVAVAAGG
ncbi:hypothetical protein FHU33_1954 [Blastococcus colisei]|uniref:EfeO-type cupredoxin-like domain-containing protein n=1 Tax=Blastococcus colisei TaxID=1564162 RepID=A0A543PEQ3_9ACTN|nr:hypothetical protein [Blastococcus colisei]TQN42550.1 hypothetical protein FHU33_1954 [Blastococcus colisei]